MSGGVWDGEYDSQSLISMDARLMIGRGRRRRGRPLTGVPQCANPFMIADRVEATGSDGPVTSIATISSSGQTRQDGPADGSSETDRYGRGCDDGAIRIERGPCRDD